MSCDFSLEHYREILRAAGEGGYRFAFFGSPPSEGDLFLRHDVDLSLEAALEMAELEAEEGVATTYLLMTRSVFYNLASREGERAIARLRELGHQVGLHAVHPQVELDARFDPVVAWHNPEPAFMTAPIDGVVNVMEQTLLRSGDVPVRFQPPLARPGVRTTSSAPGRSRGSSCSCTRRSGCTRARRWRRRCRRCSTRSGRTGSRSSATTGSTSREREASRAAPWSEAERDDLLAFLR